MPRTRTGDTDRRGSAVKRTGLLVVLIVLAVWPLVHHGLVRQLGINPWRFFGFSMYCVPRRYVYLDVFATTGGRETSMPFPASGAPPIVVDYIDRRWAYGPLLRPDALATAVFAARPDIDRLRFVVQHWELDRETRRYGTEDFEYTYDRPGGPLS